YDQPKPPYLTTLFLLLTPPPPRPPLFPYTTLFRSSVFGPVPWDQPVLAFDDDPHTAWQAGGLGAAFGQAITITFDRPTEISHLRSEEHTSELQSRFDLVCRLLLEKKNNLISCCSRF